MEMSEARDVTPFEAPKPDIKTVKIKRDKIFSKEFGELMNKIYHFPIPSNFHRVHVHKITSQVKKYGKEIQDRVEKANVDARAKFEVEKKSQEEVNALMPEISKYLEDTLKPWMEEEVPVTFVTGLNPNSLEGIKLSSADVDLLGDLYEQAEF